MWFDIHCESSYSQGGGSKSHIVALFLLALISWPIALLLRGLGFGAARDADRLGRDVVVAVPLKIRNEAQGTLRRWTTQRRLRKMLGVVSEYQELLSEYPNAKIYPR